MSKKPSVVTLGDLHASDVVLAFAGGSCFLLLFPEATFSQFQGGCYVFASIIFVVCLVAGSLSAFVFYRKNSYDRVDPFYTRALSGLIAGIVLLPICSLVRPIAFGLALIFLVFNAGPVAGFYLYQIVYRRKQ